MPKKAASLKRLSKKKAAKYDGRPDHKQKYSPLVEADIDVNMLHVINFLAVNNVATLHCCEGGRNFGAEDYEKYFDGGYIHFLHAEHLEQAILLLAGKAKEAGRLDIADRALQGNKYYMYEKNCVEPAFPDWTYSVQWAAGGPHPCVEEGERRGPMRTVFTATLRFPHEDIFALNTILAPAATSLSFVDEETVTV